MLPIQVLARPQRDEELAAIGPRTCIGHAQDAQPVVRQARHNLVVKLAAPGRLAARAVTAGKVAALDHEIFDDAVEEAVVVLACVGEGDEIEACLEGRGVSEEIRYYTS